VKRVYSVVGLLLLFVVAAFVPVLFWVYVGVGGFLVAAVLVKDRFVARRPVRVDACVLAAGRMRRFMRRANVSELQCLTNIDGKPVHRSCVRKIVAQEKKEENTPH
jgi:hypothetical protein